MDLNTAKNVLSDCECTQSHMQWELDLSAWLLTAVSLSLHSALGLTDSENEGYSAVKCDTFICVKYCESVAYRVGGGFNPPPRNSEGPPKSCQTQPYCENC